MFPIFLQKLVVSILLVAQAALAPFAAISSIGTAAVAQASSAQMQSQTIVTGYNITSPTLFNGKIWFSGMLDASTTASSIYRAAFDAEQNTWNTQKVFSLPGYQISDPSIISSGDDLLMYYTKISNTDAVGTSTALKNQIGLARSQDSGNTWTDQGTVVAQQNGIDGRGGWAPSAIVVGSEIWLYFSTNGPGTINVYRSRFNLAGQLLSVDRVYYGDGATTPLSAFNVDVAALVGTIGYSMLVNTSLSSISQYTSTDGLHWKTPDGGVNPLITANANLLLGAPAGVYNDGVVPNIYFSQGALAEKRWSSIQFASNINPQTGATLAPSSSSSNSTSNSSGNSSNSSGGSAALVGLGLLGVAGIAAFALFGGAATVASVGEDVAGEATGFSFGGRIAALLPCISPLGPSIWVQLVPASPLLPPFEYIWTPATLLSIIPPTPSIPPTHPGQEIMGRFDVPFVCFLPIVPPLPLFGYRMQNEGNSPI